MPKKKQFKEPAADKHSDDDVMPIAPDARGPISKLPGEAEASSPQSSSKSATHTSSHRAVKVIIIIILVIVVVWLINYFVYPVPFVSGYLQ